MTTADFNAVANTIGVNNALSYWRDFDSNGEVDMTDFNLMSYHITHDCDTPHNP